MLNNIWKRAIARSARYISPIAYIDAEGLFVGRDGSGWIYRILPSHSLMWQDADKHELVAEVMREMFVDLGKTSRSGLYKTTKIGSDYRNFHLLSVTWNEHIEILEGTSEEHRNWLVPIFSNVGRGQTLLAIGVKLRSTEATANNYSLDSILRKIKQEAGGEPPDPRVFSADRAHITTILERAGGRIPTYQEAMRMESWWNDGRGCNANIVKVPDGRSLATEAWANGFDISALIGFGKSELDPDHGLWAAEAFGHRDGCLALSIKGELWPSEVCREEFRKSQRRSGSRIETNLETGDLSRVEDTDLLVEGNALETFMVDTNEPMICNASVLFARRLRLESNESYIDYLRSRWGFDIKPIEHRQEQGLAEMLPCHPPRFNTVKPFSQFFNAGLIAQSGIGAHSEVGDKQGVWIGTSPPNHSPVWLDPMGASKRDKPPAMAIIGEPGSGKTFLMQMIATQSFLSGHTVFFINPKPDDSLEGFCDAIGGTTLTLSALERTPGLLDPFRYTDPAHAAEIALSHISAVLAGTIEPVEFIQLTGAITRAALEGARCVGECLNAEDIDPKISYLIREYAYGSSLFRMGVAEEPLGPLTEMSSGGLTLVQFDRKLQMPPDGVTNVMDMETAERNGIAAIRLISHAASEIMFSGNGGVLLIDEAHVFLGSKEGRIIVQKWGREGRSQAILPILGTHRIADVLSKGVDLGSYLSRVMVMKVTDDNEITAALKLAGLRNTPDRRRWLATEAGPKRNVRPAYGLLKDLDGHCTAVSIGPVTEEIHDLFSTNKEDRDRRLRELELQNEVVE